MTKRHFTADEISDLVWEPIEEEVTYRGRWDESIESTIEVDGKFYRLNWNRGLTESQENYYEEGDYEELVPVTSTFITSPSTETEYLTQEQAEERQADKFTNALASAEKVVKPERLAKAKEALAKITDDELASVLAIMDATAPLNVTQSLTAGYENAKLYMDALKELRDAVNK